MTADDGPVVRGFQQERTALAWERTAVAMILCGLLLIRFGTRESQLLLGVIGTAECLGGAAVLAWAGAHHANVDRLVRAGEPLVHAPLARAVGLGTIAFCAATFVAGTAVLLT